MFKIDLEGYAAFMNLTVVEACAAIDKQVLRSVNNGWFNATDDYNFNSAKAAVVVAVNKLASDGCFSRMIADYVSEWYEPSETGRRVATARMGLQPNLVANNSYLVYGVDVYHNVNHGTLKERELARRYLAGDREIEFTRSGGFHY